MIIILSITISPQQLQSFCMSHDISFFPFEIQTSLAMFHFDSFIFFFVKSVCAIHSLRPACPNSATLAWDKESRRHLSKSGQPLLILFFEQKSRLCFCFVFYSWALCVFCLEGSPSYSSTNRQLGTAFHVQWKVGCHWNISVVCVRGAE